MFNSKHNKRWLVIPFIFISTISFIVVYTHDLATKSIAAVDIVQGYMATDASKLIHIGETVKASQIKGNRYDLGADLGYDVYIHRSTKNEYDAILISREQIKRGIFADLIFDLIFAKEINQRNAPMNYYVSTSKDETINQVKIIQTINDHPGNSELQLVNVIEKNHIILTTGVAELKI